jgi:membrane fusion protein (multidrug efflux system)
MGAGGAPPAGPAIPVAVEPAVRGPIASYYSTTATLEPNKEADILARVSGVVTSIKAEEGDAVQKGDDVLVIQDDEYRYRLAQAEAEVDKQETKFNRLQKMFEGNLVSADEFDTARTDFEAAKAARDLAKLELSYTRVVSPFRGRVTRRLVDPGQTVSNGTPLFSIADMSRLLAKVHVPSREFGKIQSDQPVELTLDSNQKKLRGRISLVSPVIEPSTGTIKVTVEISDYPPGTRPGDFAEVRVVTERHPDAVLVNKVAVVTDRSEQVVFVAADTTAERRVVEVGFTDDEHAEIRSGIQPGERVVVQGQRSLKHGSPLKIMDRIKYDAPEEATASGAGS